MKNPFSIGIVHDSEDFCNRIKERNDLLVHARNSSNVLLSSPRRYGKSSLVTMVLADLQKEGILTVYVDLFPVSSEQDFITRFATAVFKGIGKGADPRSFAEKTKGIFAAMRPVIELGPDGYNVSVKIDRSNKTPLPLDDLMEGLHNYVQKKKLSACIVIDEFQEITELAESKKIEGVLRSHIQFQKEISYFYVGSRRRILQDMFNNKSRPFYKSAFMYSLKEIPAADFTPFICGNFRRTGKSCEPIVAGELYDMVRGYPYYVQKISSIAWDATELECTETIAKEAFRSLIVSEAFDFEGIWSGLTTMQKTLLKAIASEPTQTPYAREYLEKNQISIGGAQKSLKALLVKDLIERRENGFYRLTDPIMEKWLE